MQSKILLELMWCDYVFTEIDAKKSFNSFGGKIKFCPVDKSFNFLSENQFIFGNAIAKFQNLVRFEE